MIRFPVIAFLLALAAPVGSAQPVNTDKPAPTPEKPATAGRTLNLGECIAIALNNQPAVKAAQHSLGASQLGYQAMIHMPRYARFFSPDLPVRKQQTLRGMTVAQAEIRKVHDEVIYDVTRLYYTYVYAKQQEQTAADVIEQMEIYYRVAEEILKSGVRDPKMRITSFTLYGMDRMLSEVQLLRLKAEGGYKAALEALKEAMGVAESFEFTPRDTELPVMAGTVSKEQVLELAQTRRPELAQAAAGVDVFRLEICAQEKHRGLRSPTLASGSDLHSRQVPQAVRNGEYRPGALAPEMPTFLVGRKEDRVARATEFSLRQDAVYEKSVGLVRLDAANAYLKWDEATKRLQVAKRGFEKARKMLEESRAAAAARQDPELLVNNEALAGRAQAAYVEAVFEHLKALATLERVTSGGVHPAFPGR
jgi:outer membrane protein TolC